MLAVDIRLSRPSGLLLHIDTSMFANSMVLSGVGPGIISRPIYGIRLCRFCRRVLHSHVV